MRTKEVTYEYGNGTTATRIRIYADTGKVLTHDNINFYNCVDVDDLTGWYEVPDPEEKEMIISTENIQNKEYFTINDKIYYATATIAKGDYIIIGQNCIEKDVAEILNEIGGNE